MDFLNNFLQKQYKDGLAALAYATPEAALNKQLVIEINQIVKASKEAEDDYVDEKAAITEEV